MSQTADICVGSGSKAPISGTRGSWNTTRVGYLSWRDAVVHSTWEHICRNSHRKITPRDSNILHGRVRTHVLSSGVSCIDSILSKPLNSQMVGALVKTYWT